MWFVNRSLDDASLAVSFVGEETVEGKPVYHVHTEKVYPQHDAAANALLAKLTGTDLYIEKDTLLPVKRTQQLANLIDAQNSLAMEFRYSDYRQIQGLMIPYAVAVYANNQESAEIHFSSAVVNSGVSASEFEVRP
jgi:hypothetical protein